MRYHVYVYIKRGNHEATCYTYTTQPVKPGKVERLINDAIMEQWHRASGQGYPNPDIIDYRNGSSFKAYNLRVIVHARRVR